MQRFAQVDHIKLPLALS